MSQTSPWRCREILLLCASGCIGVILAWNFHRVGQQWFIGRERWYDSPLLPVWVAAAFLAATGFLAEVSLWRLSALGLLITAPPYGLVIPDTNVASWPVVCMLGFSGAGLGVLLHLVSARLLRRMAGSSRPAKGL